MTSGGLVITKFDAGEALTLTLIAVGTAFAVLVLLMLVTTALKHVKPFFERSSHLNVQPEKDDDHDKALAAAIAVSLALQDSESTKGNTPNEN